VTRKAAVLRTHCEAVGRDPETVEVTQTATTLVGRDATELAAIVERLRPPRQSADRYAASVNAGTVTDQIGRYRALADAGVGTVMTAFPDLDDGAIERFAPVIAAFS
jgi:alkanesulfonate monooxygenase SsuD/methylene tetrahydromethanopterin reductase-like flavin-dependent oxidoreductase (luciferase family)